MSTYNIHDFLTVESDVDYFPDYFRESTSADEDNEQKLQIKIHDKKISEKTDFKNGLGKNHRYNDDSVYFTKKFLGSNFEVLVTGMNKKTTELHMSSRNAKTVPLSLPMADIYRLAEYIKTLLIIKLLKEGVVFTHSSVIETDGKGILLAGFPGSGKTVTSIESVLKYDSSILSDDRNLIDMNGNAYTYAPRKKFSIDTIYETSLSKKYNIRFRNARKKLNAVLNIASLLPTFPYAKNSLTRVDISDTLSDYQISSTAVQKILVLERGDENQVSKMSSKNAKRKLISIFERKMHYFNSNNILLAGGYINDELSYKDIKNSYFDIIDQFVENTDCYLVESRSASAQFDVVSENIY